MNLHTLDEAAKIALGRRLLCLPPVQREHGIEALNRIVAETKRGESPLVRYCPHTPHDRQAVALASTKREMLYGGAAGGGKSDFLLMAALEYVDIPGYAALILRRTFPDLSKPGAIMDRAESWLRGTDAQWNDRDKTWTFPSGARLVFGYLQHEADKYQYQGAELQFCGFDELTQFTETQYRYLFSRLRRLKSSDVPLRMRAATNPGGIGHDWVKSRFNLGLDPNERDAANEAAGREFVRADLDDNPHLDREEYEQALAELDPVTRAQLRSGDWSAANGGTLFKRESFEIIDQPPAGCRWVRFWDLAATEAKAGKDPDWTAGGLLGHHRGLGVWVIADMRRTRAEPASVESLIRQTAELDGRSVPIRMEQEPGASGKSLVSHYARNLLVGYDFRGVPARKDKVTRAAPVSAAASWRNVKLVRGAWNKELLDQFEAFPEGSHDDQVDAISGGFECLSTRGPVSVIEAYS